MPALLSALLHAHGVSFEGLWSLACAALSSGTVSFEPSCLGLLRLSASPHQLRELAGLCLGEDFLCYGVETKAVSCAGTCFLFFQRSVYFIT